MFAKWIKGTSLFLIFLMPASMMGANMVGVVRVAGTDATIDGQPCSTVVVGFEGERLATGANSTATVTSRGTLVSVSSNTSVKLGTKALELIAGSVVVSSDTGTSTKVENVTISTPVGEHAKFLAQRVDDQLQLVALEGKVDVDDGQQTAAVPAAKGVKVKVGKDSKDTSDTGSKNSWLTNDDIGILLVVVGGVAAGVGVGIANSGGHKTAVSPVQ